MADWSLTGRQLKLVKIAVRVMGRASAFSLKMVEPAVTGSMARAILAAIRRRRAPP